MNLSHCVWYNRYEDIHLGERRMSLNVMTMHLSRHGLDGNRGPTWEVWAETIARKSMSDILWDRLNYFRDVTSMRTREETWEQIWPIFSFFSIVRVRICQNFREIFTFKNIALPIELTIKSARILVGWGWLLKTPKGVYYIVTRLWIRKRRTLQVSPLKKCFNSLPRKRKFV